MPKSHSNPIKSAFLAQSLIVFIPEHGKESNSPSYERRVSLMAFLGIGMKPISPFFGE